MLDILGALWKMARLLGLSAGETLRFMREAQQEIWELTRPG